jgi:hypothetical protein
MITPASTTTPPSSPPPSSPPPELELVLPLELLAPPSTLPLLEPLPAPLEPPLLADPLELELPLLDPLDEPPPLEAPLLLAPVVELSEEQCATPTTLKHRPAINESFRFMSFSPVADFYTSRRTTEGIPEVHLVAGARRGGSRPRRKL